MEKLLASPGRNGLEGMESTEDSMVTEDGQLYEEYWPPLPEAGAGSGVSPPNHPEFHNALPSNPIPEQVLPQSQNVEYHPGYKEMKAIFI